MKNYISSGDVLDLTAPAGGVVSGMPYQIGEFFGVAQVSAAEGETFALARRGNFELPAATHATTQAIAEGGKVYWDNTAKILTATATSNRLVGGASAAKISTVGSVKVCLQPSPGL